MKNITIAERIAGLVVFRELKQDPVFDKFQKMITALDFSKNLPKDTNVKSVIYAVAEFETALFAKTTNWTDYLYNFVLESDNICVRLEQAGKCNDILKNCLLSELEFLQEISSLTLGEILSSITVENPEKFLFLPVWETSQIDFKTGYLERLSQADKKGYGMFAKYNVFVIDNGALSPVRFPDNQSLAELPGYERERAKIISNTKALLNGESANNVLLYGDAGTGKSSAVKAIVNEFAPEGLRLVEVKKNQLYQLPEIMETLAENPLKFILFIDDLSFSASDDNFSALKAILEGSVCGRTPNIAIYATSNRRHLVKESINERMKEEMHAADSRQELMSLSARFGLVVTFLKPEKDRYAKIVTALAEKNGIEENEQLHIASEAFALRAGGRSPRVAKQFVELFKVGAV